MFGGSRKVPRRGLEKAFLLVCLLLQIRGKVRARSASRELRAPLADFSSVLEWCGVRPGEFELRNWLQQKVLAAPVWIDRISG